MWRNKEGATKDYVTTFVIEYKSWSIRPEIEMHEQTIPALPSDGMAVYIVITQVVVVIPIFTNVTI